MVETQTNRDEQGPDMTPSPDDVELGSGLDAHCTENGGAATKAGEDTAWVRHHLSGSVYLWACGERAENDHDVPELSDGLIGWAVLLVQVLAYSLIIHTKKPDDVGIQPGDEDKGYSMGAVTGAVYLLVASTISDLRAGFPLLFDGPNIGTRIFGLSLLTMYGLMITAALQVLIGRAEDDATALIEAVTVLFIADLDEHALKFFSGVSKPWRLYWAIHSIGTSFTLALLAVVYIADSDDASSDELGDDLKENVRYVEDFFYSWFFWVVNPVGVTMCASVLSASLQALSDSCSNAYGGATNLSWCMISSRLLACFFGAIETAKSHAREEPWFCAAHTVWFCQGVASWWLIPGWWNPVAFDYDFFDDDSPYGDSYDFSHDYSCDNSYSDSNSGSYNDPDCDDERNRLAFKGHHEYVAFGLISAALATGLSMMALRMCLSRHECLPCLSEWCKSSDNNGCTANWGSLERSRLPSLLVGWGFGYWVTSLLYVLCIAWDDGGWYPAPAAVEAAGYVIVPSFVLGGFFVVAETNFLGNRVGGFAKPIVGILRDRRRVWYWITKTVLRDVLLFCMLLWWYLMGVISLT